MAWRGVAWRYREPKEEEAQDEKSGVWRLKEGETRCPKGMERNFVRPVRPPSRYRAYAIPCTSALGVE
jgi:hypothetical protein